MTDGAGYPHCRTLPVPEGLLEWGRCVAEYACPSQRTRGFAETGQQSRGHGDLMDCVASQVFAHYLASAGVACSADTTYNMGDRGDIHIVLKGNLEPFDMKTSSYETEGPHLHLIVKECDLAKPMFGYIQAFVHLHDAKPHCHFVGVIATRSPRWKACRAKIVEIPGTGGGRGVMVPIADLLPVDHLISLALAERAA